MVGTIGTMEKSNDTIKGNEYHCIIHFNCQPSYDWQLKIALHQISVKNNKQTVVGITLSLSECLQCKCCKLCTIF